MATSETGHAKNVANFETLYTFCTGYGTSYNPSNEAISLNSIGTVLTNSQNSVKIVNSALTNSSNAIAAREILFAPLGKLVTRVVNAAASSEIAEQVVDNIKTVARKLQGKRADDNNDTPPPADPNAPPGDDSNNISVSQLSCDNKVSNMQKLIAFLSAQTAYAPNEVDLTVANLTGLYTRMDNVNKLVKSTGRDLSNARIARNEILYKEKSGLIYIAATAKTYVKSAFGASSPQYKQISKIQFTNLDNK